MTLPYCRTILLLVPLWLHGSAVFAQSTEKEELALVYGDKATVSIATGRAQSIRRAPAVATVITAEEIAAMGATDLDQVLETVPGMHVNRSADANAPIYQIRGIGGAGPTNPQILMLQNGVPMTTLYLGDKGLLWDGYPVEQIARIEVIRGPGSALYGADAYAGVINIITKTAADTPGTQVGMRGGSFNTRDAWVQHGGQLGPVDLAAYLRMGNTDGYKQTIGADAQTRLDQIFGTQASLAPGPLNNGYRAVDSNLDLSYDKWRLRGGYKLRDKVETGAGVASALDPVGRMKSERITADVSWADPHTTRDWGTGFTASYLHYTQLGPAPLVLFPPGANFFTGPFPNGLIAAPETWDRQLRMSTFATYSGFTNHSLRFGLGHDDLNLYRTHLLSNYEYAPSGLPTPLGAVIDNTNIAPFLRPQHRWIDYAYAQDEWTFTREWTLTGGIRHDRYSDFGGTTNPRLALVWDANQEVTAKLLYGHAFRAPSFNEQFGINPVASGNPSIGPETIKTTEAALSWKAGKDTQVNLSVFRYAMQDIISLVPNPAPAPGATYANTGRQNGQGMELEVVHDIGRNLRLSGNYSYQRSIDEMTNQDVGYAPHHHLYARADWQWTRGWLLSSQVNHVADRRRTSDDTRPQIPDYTMADVTLRSNRMAKHWEIALSVHNLFNVAARDPSLAATAVPGLPNIPTSQIPNDLPLAGRSVYVQVVRRW